MKDIIKILRDSSEFAKRTGKHNLTAFGMTDLLDAAANRITDLEAQLEAIKNPPYTLIVDEDHSWGVSDWFWEVTSGATSIWRMGGYEFKHEANAEGKAFLDRLTAPFKSKD